MHTCQSWAPGYVSTSTRPSVDSLSIKGADPSDSVPRSVDHILHITTRHEGHQRDDSGLAEFIETLTRMHIVNWNAVFRKSYESEHEDKDYDRTKTQAGEG